jgi:hypothetical protein
VCVCWLLVVCVCVFVCLCVCVCVCVFVACEHKHEGKSELGVLDACARRGLGTHLFWQITASAYSAGLHWHPKPCILTLCWSYLSLWQGLVCLLVKDFYGTRYHKVARWFSLINVGAKVFIASVDILVFLVLALSRVTLTLSRVTQAPNRVNTP